MSFSPITRLRYNLRWCLLGLAVVASQTTNAATLFSTVGRSQDNPYNFTGGILASDFNTGNWTSTVTGLNIVIAKLFNSDVVTASIYTDAGGKPGSALGSFNPINIPGYLSTYTTASYSTTTTGINLAANTNYWLAITINTNVGVPMNNGNSTDGGDLFATLSATPVKQSYDGGSSWNNVSSANMLYSLTGTATAVPEPSRAVLLMGGMGTLLFRRKRRVFSHSKCIFPMSERRCSPSKVTLVLSA